MSRTRSGLLVGMSLGILFAVTACVPVPRVEATIVDGALVLVDCEIATGVDTIRASVAPVDGGKSREVWLLVGDGDFGPERPIVYGEVPEGFTVEYGPDAIDLPAVRIRFSLTGFAGGVRYSDTWNLKGSDLREGVWLDQDGRLDTSPCT